MKTLPLLPAALIAASGLAHAATQTVNITMSEMKFTPAAFTLKAGQHVTLQLSNTGKTAHEFQAYLKPATPPSGEAAWDAYMKKNTLWLGSKDVKLTVNGKSVTGPFFEVQLQPGQKATLSFTPAKAGVFEIGCHKPGHFEGGMKGTITVK